VTNETRLVLVNALYFLGRWQRPFEASATRPAPFHLTPALARDVPTMHQTGSFRYLARGGLKALELPYEGGGLALLVVLPDAVDGLPAVEGSLDAGALDALVAGLAPARVHVAVPRFEVNPAAPLSLADTLAALGLAVAFDRARADFTGIAPPPPPPPPQVPRLEIFPCINCTPFPRSSIPWPGSGISRRIIFSSRPFRAPGNV